MFELPTIQGHTVALRNYREQKNVILWFSRGFTCNFCRSYMDDMVRNYPAVQATQTEIIQVSPNLHYTAQSYFPPETPPFPFVCDPDKRLYAVYGLGDRGVLEATKNTVISFTAPLAQGLQAELETIRASWVDTMNRNFLRRLQHHALTAMEQGVYIIDRQGVIRYRQVLGALDMIPTAETLVQLTVELCL
ncbi:MAG: redoxin domain-containing protein [Chloroflexi bacterium]|nr:redoxin domain-containing protein [Chloroflexota bacterium]MBP8054918.1 redoxin domain-containing protein [Chloroflexota bacterium]